tara:strand:- start:352 stop:819 length:468 start_codon:yes stop_codon:yes gene_type:complete
MRLPRWLTYTAIIKGGDSKLFRIRINPKYKEDKGLLAHEEEHVRQWYIFTLVSFVLSMGGLITYGGFDIHYSWWLMVLTYSSLGYNMLSMVSKKFRFFIETKCYAAQVKKYSLKHREYYIKAFAKFLTENYDLGITNEVATAALRKELGGSPFGY